MIRPVFVLFLLAALLGIGVPFVLAGVDAFAGIADLGASWLLLLAAVMLVAINLNVLRFRILLRHYAVGLTQFRGLAALLAAAFASNVTPGGVGAPVMAVAVVRRYQVPGSIVLAALAVAAVMDLVVLAALLLVAVVWTLMGFTDVTAFVPALFACAVVAGMLVVLWLFIAHDRAILRFISALMHRAGVPGRQRRAIIKRLFRFRSGVRTLAALPRGELLFISVLCVIHRLLRYSVVYIAVLALGGNISWLEGFFVQMLSLGAARLLMLPGGAGGAELVGIALLARWVGTADAATVILVWRFFTFYAYLLAGGVVTFHLLGRQAFAVLQGRSAGGMQSGPSG